MNIPKITISKDIEGKYIAVLDSYTQETSSIMKHFHMQVENAIENILRNHAIPPIKGEITKSKLRWRGITSTVYSDNGFVGILQRGVLITVDGRKYSKIDGKYELLDNITTTKL